MFISKQYGEGDINLRDEYKIISKKITCTALIAIGIAGILFGIIYYIGKGYLSNYFFMTDYIYDSERPYIEEFERYVYNNSVSTSDYEKMRNWIDSNEIAHFSLSSDGVTLYEVSNMDKLIVQTKKLYDYRWTEPFHYKVRFTDMEADVYIYASYLDDFYKYLIRGDLAVSAIVCVLLIFIRIRKLLKDILGRLHTAEEGEQEARKEKDNLMGNMAHDLRTPLTGLLSFIEIIKMENENGMPITEHIEIVETKAKEIKELTDQMFDFSLASTEDDIVMNEAQEIEYAIGDYLSEMYGVITEKGYSVDIRKMKWEKVDISVNSGFMGRIFNNITDNICKYADGNKPVIIETSYPKGKAVVKISNSVCIEKKLLESAGIGLKNVSIMMDRMGGKMLYHLDNKDFYVTLEFPVSK